MMELLELLIGDGLSFLSIGYLFFLLAAALVRYLCPRKERALILLLLSWLFYCTWNPACLLFVLVSTVSTWLGGLYVGQRSCDGPESGTAAGKPLPHRKAVLVLVLLLNLGLLFFCKYWSMFFPGFEDRLLPLGISFYTLQALGYLMDCWRYGSAAVSETGPSSDGMPKRTRSGDRPYLEGYPPELRFVNYALFVSFFPGILSGPIERGRNMLPQFDDPCDFSYDNMRNGLTIMLWGYFLKMVVADRIAIVVDTVYANPGQWGGAIVLLAVLLYSIQIYCDFAGYSAIAVGSARLLGLRVMNNFEAPYLSGSVAEFWRRWHISLSSWFRDYLYIPLGGSRKGTGRRYLNILIVFAVSGLWHGADISFVVWGLLHGVYQVIGYILKPARDGAVRMLHINRSSASHRFLKTAVTFLLVSFAWIFFRADSMAQAMQVIGCLPGFRIGASAFSAGEGWTWSILQSQSGLEVWKLFDGTLLNLGLDTMNWVLLSVCLVLLLVRDLCVLRGVSLRVQLQQQGRWLRWMVYIVLVLLILVCGVWGPDYDATTFIYSQF